MKLKELKTTPLPWSIEIGEQCCFHKGNRVSIVRWSKDGPEEDNCETVAEVWSTAGDSDIADGKLITHCVNHFGAVVEALENLAHAARVAATRAVGFDKMALERDSEKAAYILAAATNIPDMGKEKPEAEGECPNCHNGTIGLENGRLICRGECGHDFGASDMGKEGEQQ